MAILRVREPFSCDAANGVQLVYRKGDLVDSADPVVTPSRQVFFEPVEMAAARSVTTTERATAAPDERRTITTPRKKADSNG